MVLLYIFKEFVLYFELEALKYISFLKKLSHNHASWVVFLQEYFFVIKHKKGIENEIVGNDSSHKDFSIARAYYPNLSLHKEYLFKGILELSCLPIMSFWLEVILELYWNGIIGHFGSDKAIAIKIDLIGQALKEMWLEQLLNFMSIKFLEGKHNIGFYMSQLVPHESCTYISMD